MIIYLMKYVILLFLNKWKFSLLMYYCFFVWKVDCQRNLRSIVQGPSNQVKSAVIINRNMCQMFFGTNEKNHNCLMWDLKNNRPSAINIKQIQCNLQWSSLMFIGTMPSWNFLYLNSDSNDNLHLWVIFPTVLKSIHTCTTRVICSSSYSISVSIRA